MVAIPLTRIFRDVNIQGATKRKIIRVRDTTIRTLKAGYIFVEAVKDIDGNFVNYDSQTKEGNSLIGGWRFFHTGTDIVVADDAAFNNQPVFQGTGTEHHFSIPDPPSLESQTIIQVLSMPQSVLDAADAFTGNSYSIATYDPVANLFIAGMQFTGSGAFKGWALNPQNGIGGNAMNVSIATFPAARPVADTPFVVAWTIDAATTTSRFYFNDGETPITSKGDHGGINAGGGDKRYYPMSFSIGSNTASWEGKMAVTLIHDDSNPSTAMTDAQRIAIFDEIKAAYDIA